MMAGLHKNLLMGYSPRKMVITRHPKIQNYLVNNIRLTEIELEREEPDDEGEYYNEDGEPLTGKYNVKLERTLTRTLQDEIVLGYEKLHNVTKQAQMIMTIQNPVDWASLFWSDSEEFDNINIPQDTEILLKAYKKLLSYMKQSCEIINRKFGKRCFLARIEDILSNPRNNLMNNSRLQF